MDPAKLEAALHTVARAHGVDPARFAAAPGQAKIAAAPQDMASVLRFLLAAGPIALQAIEQIIAEWSKANP